MDTAVFSLFRSRCGWKTSYRIYHQLGKEMMMEYVRRLTTSTMETGRERTQRKPKETASINMHIISNSQPGKLKYVGDPLRLIATCIIWRSKWCTNLFCRATSHDWQWARAIHHTVPAQFSKQVPFHAQQWAQSPSVLGFCQKIYILYIKIFFKIKCLKWHNTNKHQIPILQKDLMGSKI